MKKPIIVSLALCAALLSSATAGHASHTEQGSYTVASTPGVGILCSPNCLGEPGVSVGGYRFSPVGEVPIRVDVADSLGGPVPFSVCQDTNGNNVCGQNDPVTGQPIEPSVAVCGTTADLTTSVIPFTSSHEVLVFVRSAASTCSGVATSGTITLTFA